MGLIKMEEKELLSNSIVSSIKLMMWPLIGLGLSLAILILLSQQGYSRVKNEIKSLNDSKNMSNALSEKLSVLEEAKIEVSIHTESVSKALPGDNSSLIMLSHINVLAEESDVVITKKSVDRSTETDSLSSSQVMLTVQSDSIENILKFVEELTNVTPLSTLNKLTVNKGVLDKASSDMEIAVYWSDFPVKISGISEPIIGLTLEDKELVSKVSTLKESEIYEVVPNTPTEREDPFN